MLHRWIPEPRLDRPLPLGVLFPLFFAAIYLAHITLLRLPYYWDEAGYYIPSAFDFFRTGSLIPYSTLTNAHPPLPSIYLAFWWKLGGFAPSITRTAMCVVAACALLAVWRLTLAFRGTSALAIWAVLLTALYPIWFVQSTLAHADMLAACFTLWALSYALPEDGRNPWAAAIFFSLAALSKETAIVTPAALCAWEAWQWLRSIRHSDRRSKNLLPVLCYAATVLPLACWYAYHKAKTGFLFGNPEYLRYNATSTLSALRLAAAFGHRILHLTAHMNLFVPVLCALAALLLDILPEVESDDPREHIPLPSLKRIAVVLLANAAAFSVLGGALLTRYLLPMYPLVLLLCLFTWRRHVRQWYLLATLSSVAFLLGLFTNPPYRFAPEDNLSYKDVIQLHQQAVYQVQKRLPGSTVLTAWPVTDELTKPELGYVRTPMQVVAIDNFAPAEIEKAARLPQAFTSAIVFSTKYDPPNLPFNLGRHQEEMDEKYFGLHHDLSPQQVAEALHGSVVWKREHKWQWAAVIGFQQNGPQYAQLLPHL